MNSDSEKPLAGRIALVTGATRGIGEAVAVGLAKAGAHVIALGRTQGALEALDDTIFAATGEHATLVPLDLREADGLDQLGAALYERFGKLDIVVGAAGVLGALTPVGHLDPKGWDMIMAVNLTANWRLIRAMDPLLRRAEAGRAIFLTSSVAQTHRAFWGGYAASKAGLEAIVACYDDEMENTTVRAVSVDPGAMRTRMRAGAFPGEDPLSVPAPDTIVPLIVDLARPDRVPPKGVIRFKDRGQNPPASVDLTEVSASRQLTAAAADFRPELLTCGSWRLIEKQAQVQCDTLEHEFEKSRFLKSP